jgi:hemolysin III
VDAVSTEPDTGRAADESTLPERLEESVERGLGDAFERAAGHVPDAVKPKLRGWLHAGTVPFALVAGIVLVALSDTAAEIVASTIYAVTTVLLFTVSAIYHRGNWSPRTKGLLKRFDHANIFLIIAGTYTPFAVLLLGGGSRAALLWIVWVGAAFGVAFRVLWPHAPRWLVVPTYVALGWVAVAFLPQITRAGGLAVLVLIAVGGLLYTLGAMVYGTKRPDPYPTWFGFHEVFHTLVVAAYLCQYVAVSLVVYGR